MAASGAAPQRVGQEAGAPVRARRARTPRTLRRGRSALTALDVAGSDTVPVTHEFLSHMLGVRYSGVTAAVGALEQAGLVARGRGFVRVENHVELGPASCGCHGLLADEYGKFINDLAGL